MKGRLRLLLVALPLALALLASGSVWQCNGRSAASSTEASDTVGAEEPPSDRTRGPGVEGAARGFLEILGSDSLVFQASFQQVTRWFAIGEVDSTSGRLWIGPDGLFRLAYESGETYGCDGVFVYSILPAERQAIRATADAATNWASIFKESLKAARVLSDSIAGGERLTLSAGAIPELGVDSAWAVMDPILGRPVAYGHLDAEGNVFEFRFLASGFAPLPTDSLFRFEIPEGYELFESY